MSRIRNGTFSSGARGRLGSLASGRTPLLTSAPAPPVLEIPDAAGCVPHGMHRAKFCSHQVHDQLWSDDPIQNTAFPALLPEWPSCVRV